MIYLDFNAASPLKAEVSHEVSANWHVWANPGSVQHKSGAAADSVLQSARSRIASALEQSPAEVILTSSATESASIAILGIALSKPAQKRGIAVLRTEHKAVIAAAELASSLLGTPLHFVEVDREGLAIEESLIGALSQNVSLLACMQVNNETGVIQNLPQIAALCARFGAELVCDVTQAVGRVPLPGVLHESTYFFSGHKIGTPKGIGCLVLPRRLQANFVSIIPGGGQERGIRGGTENSALAAGLAKAIEIAFETQESFVERSTWAVSKFIDQLKHEGVDFEIVASRSQRVSNTVNIHFRGIDGDAILANLFEVEASTGSACNSANPEPSHVLLAMGYSFREAASCVRFSFGDTHSSDEIERAAQDVCQAVYRVKSYEKGVD